MQIRLGENNPMKLISKTTASLIFVALTCFITATAHAITYNVNRTVGANGFIFGTIDTDDTIGQVTLTSNIISWNLDRTINSTSVNMSSATGGGLLQSGVALETTPTELRWVLGSAASAGGAAFCQTGCGLGNTQWRWACCIVNLFRRKTRCWRNWYSISYSI
jgi:hypothetical protein